MALQGDLTCVHLGDIFQTLAANRQEGVLVVTQGERTKRIYFQDGRIALLASRNRRGFRLGDRLISRGKLTPAALQEALAQHEATGRPLGEVLVARGDVTPADVEETLRFQAEEEIYELFTWRDARFEFVEGPPPEDRIQNPDMARIFFNVANVVMEAARRQDEWELIRRDVPDLNEIYVPADEPPDPEEVDWLARRVLAALNGRRTVNDLAEETGYATFDVAKLLRELLRAGRVRPATAAELETTLGELVKAREYDRALTVLGRLLDRVADPVPYLKQGVQLGREAGRFEETSRFALALSERLVARGDLAGAEKWLRRAARVDLRNGALQDRLLEVLRRRGAGEAYLRCALHVADLALKGGEPERAEAVLAEALKRRPRDFRLLEGLTEALLRRGRREEALARLGAVLQSLDPRRDRRRVELVAERMVRLGSRDPRVARILQQVRRRRAATVRRRVVLLGTLLPLLLFAGHLLEGYRHRREAESLLQTAREAWRAGELWRARAMLRRLLAAGVGGELAARARELEGEVRRRLAAELAALKAANERENRRLLAAAAEALRAGRLTRALEEYRKLAARAGRGHGYETARTGLRRLRAALETARGRLLAARADLARRPPPEAGPRARLAAYDRLLRDPLREESARLLVRLQRLAGAEPLRREVEALRPLARDVVRIFGELERERRTHAEILRREELYRYVNAEWLAAHEAFARGELERARRHLRRIVATPYGERPLEEIQTFLREVERILELSRRSQRPRDLQELAQLFARIQETLRRYPQLEGSMKLPLQIRTDPPGAAVYLAGRLLGRADPALTLTYRHGSDAVVEVRLPGFAPCRRSLRGNREWLWVIRLTRAVHRRWCLGGPVVAPPRMVGGDLLVAARDGVVYVLDPAGGVRRRLRTPSLGGLAAPVAWDEERVYAAVQEGYLHAYRRGTYASLWRRPLGSAVYAAPAVGPGGRVYVATEAGELLALEAPTGRVAWRFRARGPLRGTPLVRGRRVYVTSLDGRLYALDADTGRRRWVFRAAEALEAPPVTDGRGRLYVVDTWRYVYALEERTGAEKWRTAAGGAVAPPTVDGASLFVAIVDRAVKRLRLRDGKLLATYPVPATLAAPPVVHGGVLYQAAKDGRLRVYRVADGRRLWEYAAGGPLLAPPLLAGNRLYLAATDGIVVALEP